MGASARRVCVCDRDRVIYSTVQFTFALRDLATGEFELNNKKTRRKSKCIFLSEHCGHSTLGSFDGQLWYLFYLRYARALCCERFALECLEFHRLRPSSVRCEWVAINVTEWCWCWWVCAHFLSLRCPTLSQWSVENDGMQFRIIFRVYLRFYVFRFFKSTNGTIIYYLLFSWATRKWYIN